MKTKMVVFGTAEIAQLARFYFEHDDNYKVVAFTVDDKFVEEDTVDGLPVIPFSEVVGQHPPDDYYMHVALSYTKLNRLRAEKFRQAKEAGYKLASYVSSKAVLWPDHVVGENCFILEQNNIQPTVRIGDNVVLWSGNHIGHGTVIRDHVYLASHICVSGHCDIGERTFIGVNAAIRDFCTIGVECFVTMNAAVSKSTIPDGAVVFGPPSFETLASDDRKARAVKKKYFNLE